MLCCRLSSIRRRPLTDSYEPTGAPHGLPGSPTPAGPSKLTSDSVGCRPRGGRGHATISCMCTWRFTGPQAWQRRHGRADYQSSGQSGRSDHPARAGRRAGRHRAVALHRRVRRLRCEDRSRRGRRGVAGASANTLRRWALQFARICLLRSYLGCDQWQIPTCKDDLRPARQAPARLCLKVSAGATAIAPAGKAGLRPDFNDGRRSTSSRCISPLVTLPQIPRN
jgi:hypothetical protein